MSFVRTSITSNAYTYRLPRSLPGSVPPQSSSAANLRQAWVQVRRIRLDESVSGSLCLASATVC